jgi:hypothetical protein
MVGHFEDCSTGEEHQPNVDAAVVERWVQECRVDGLMMHSADSADHTVERAETDHVGGELFIRKEESEQLSMRQTGLWTKVC